MPEVRRSVKTFVKNIGLGQTLIPINFESDLDHHLDTKTKIRIFN